ncbi:hypothetical protein ACNOYE_31035 [Nannocystaceae bacterium ST9]
MTGLRMTEDPRDTFSSAARRTVDWLLSQQRDDGSLGPERHDLAYYYKTPLLLLLAGHSGAAQRMLDFVARNFQQQDGHFASSSKIKTLDPLLAQYDAYIDGWLAIAAHRSGRFELARPAWAHLRRFANPGFGGFCLSGHYRGDGSDVIELLTTAHLGMTALYCGELPLALAAGHCLRRFWEYQPDPERRLLLRMDDAGEFIDRWPNDTSSLHVVECGAAKQAWFFVGYPIAFLVMLARATGNSANLARAHLATAAAFAGFAERCGDALLVDHSAHKVAWALGLLAQVSGDPKHRALAMAIARGMVERQSEAGTWLDAGPDHTRVEQSAETALWLFELATM